MVRFHFPVDRYFPNQGNVGSLDAEPEEEPAIPLDDELVEDLPKYLDNELEVENLPPAAQIQIPNPRLTFLGPTPLWGIAIDRWSNEQGQNHPYQGDRSFYNLEPRASVDRALLFWFVVLLAIPNKEGLLATV